MPLKIWLRCIVSAAGLCLSLTARATPDTLRITLPQADSLFLSHNFYLLASSMNIEVQRAQIIQAKLYPNPAFTVDLNVYDGQNKKAFHVGETGQKAFQVDQLILLGGKRKAQIELAKTNAAIAALEFQSLLGQLKFKLHTRLVEIGQQQVLLRKYNAQLALVDTILFAYEQQVNNGNLPLKDLVRLKGVYLNLNNDRAELLYRYYEAQAEAQTLLQTQQLIVFRFSDRDLDKYIKVKQLDELQSEALANHPRMLMIQQDQMLARQLLSYNKRLAVPDINLFASYDQRGGAFTHQINSGIAIPLPLWNRNQGNIKAMQYRIQETEYLQQAAHQETLNGLQNNFALYTQTVAEYQKVKRVYGDDFEITIKGMSDNFKKRNVSLIEFVDFFESYNQVLAELARMKTQLVTSAELLNLSVGKDIY